MGEMGDNRIILEQRIEAKVDWCFFSISCMEKRKCPLTPLFSL
jgi:hypothetical protein